MVTIVKHEWHSVDSQFAYELTEDDLSEIYPDLKKKEIKSLLKQIEKGEVDVESIIDEACEVGYDIEWDRQYDDWFSDRKGGYDITYDVGDEDSWHTPPEEAPAYWKCTKCRWEGKKYESLTQYLRADGTVIEDYHLSDEESDNTKEVCPMCDSDIKLTPEGEKDEEETKQRLAEFETFFDERAVPCFVCNEEYTEGELTEMDGQYVCPNCGEDWVMPEDRPR